MGAGFFVPWYVFYVFCFCAIYKKKYEQPEPYKEKEEDMNYRSGTKYCTKNTSKSISKRRKLWDT